MSSPSTVPTSATPDVCTLALLVDGQDVSGDLQVRSIAVNRELNRIPTAAIQLEDGSAANGTFAVSNSDRFLPGKKIEIQLGYRSQNKTVFKGLIVKQRITVRKGGTALNVDCSAEAVKMTRGNKSRYYINKKDSDVMEELLDAHGLPKDVEATTPTLKEVVQYDSTDWDFLLCRAEANGQVVLVRDDKVRVAKPATSGSPVLKLAYGSTVLELDAEIDSRLQIKGVKASSWNPADQAVVEAEAKEPSTPAAGNIAATDLANVLGDDTNEIKHAGELAEPELQSWADARLLRTRLAKIRGTARCQGFAAVLPDQIVEITAIGERFEGMMYVSGVHHSVSAGNWETDVQFGLNPELFTEAYNLRPLPAAGLLPVMSGLQMGIVTALENDPDSEERIQCRLPLVSPNEEGIWARLATLDAGKDRGTYFRPEINDEVVVGFLNDDPRYPVILGMCHSSAKPAPEPAKDTNHHKGYVSREKLKLTFDDEKKIIGLETPAGNKITLSEDAKGIVLEDQNGNKITMDDSGLKIESAKDMVFKAANDVMLSGTNAELNARTGFKASGTTSVEVSGGMATIQGNSMTSIKGAQVQVGP
jgi:Rhs element Vgr protein